MVTKAHEIIPNVEYQPQRESSAGVELCSLESLYSRSHGLDFDPFAPHRVQFHHLLYIAEGMGTHFVDFNRHDYQTGTFVWVSKNQIHAFDRQNRPAGVMILFTQDFLDSIHTSMRVPTSATGFHLVGSSPVMGVHGELKDSCEALLSEITRVTGRAPHDRLILQLLLACLFLKLRQQDRALHETPVNEARHQQLQRFMSLIEASFHTTKDAAAYAQMMGVTYKTLNVICKKSVRKTPKQLIDAHTILEAKRRLAIDNIQISQLAYELGFQEVTNFVKYFKKHTAETPSQFQRRLSG
ncbi:MAG: helix-turn-helix transcriptional regulator [Gammaproteobacteria bacterium]